MFYAFWGITMALSAILVARRMSKCKKPFSAVLRSSLGGLALLMLIHIMEAVLGFAIPINYVTVSAAVILGPPGTILLLILNLFL